MVGPVEPAKKVRSQSDPFEERGQDYSAIAAESLT